MIDLGLSNPDTVEALNRTYAIVDEVVDRLHSLATSTPMVAGSELYRLDQSLPHGPLSFGMTVMAAIDGARGALDQAVCLLRDGVPTSPIALHALVRAALVGSARTAYALLPSDPDERLQKAATALRQDLEGWTRASRQYREFGLMPAPPDELVEESFRQLRELSSVGPKLGDGGIVLGMTRAISDALLLAPEFGAEHVQMLSEHATWLWNTYSGAAHALYWPRLLPGSGQDTRIPGDYVGDLYMVAVAAHVAMHAVLDRLQQDTAGESEALDLSTAPWG